MTAPEPIPNRFNMASYILEKARVFADKPALEILCTNQTQVWSYTALDTRIRQIAAGLRGAGIEPGDKVLLGLGNDPSFPMAYLACIALDALPVPLSPQLTKGEIGKICSELSPKLILTDPADVDRLASTQPMPAADMVMGDPDRPAYLVYTSGTSGRPRAVVHAHRAIWARRMMWDDWYGLRASDRVLHAGAFNWTYTMGTGLMDPWAIGATALIPEAGTSAEALPSLISRHKATIFAAAPAVYRRILRSSFPELPSLRHGLSAGEAMAPALVKAWEDRTGTKVHQAFGMTECSTFISSSPSSPAPRDAIGWVQNGRLVKLMHDGQIAVHKDEAGLMLGYLNAPDEMATRFDGDWFLTGDLGAQGPDGAIRYLGRVDDMMNADGHRVSPLEVEGALASHPAIAEVAVCSVQKRTDLALTAAFYVSTDLLDTEGLDSFAQAQLARYKCPRIWVRLDTLPRGANNKLNRRKLRADWEAANGQT